MRWLFFLFGFLKGFQKQKDLLGITPFKTGTRFFLILQYFLQLVNLIKECKQKHISSRHCFRFEKEKKFIHLTLSID